jgi:hypothetical protein
MVGSIDAAESYRLFSSRSLIPLLALLVAGPRLSAQRPEQLRVSVAPALSRRLELMQMPQLSLPSELSICTEDRLIGIGVGATLGAGAGWLMYKLSIGALSSSRTSASGPAPWMWGGAALGALWGALAASPHHECR